MIWTFVDPLITINNLPPAKFASMVPPNDLIPVSELTLPCKNTFLRQQNMRFPKWFWLLDLFYDDWSEFVVVWARIIIKSLNLQTKLLHRLRPPLRDTF